MQTWRDVHSFQHSLVWWRRHAKAPTVRSSSNSHQHDNSNDSAALINRSSHSHDSAQTHEGQHEDTGHDRCQSTTEPQHSTAPDLQGTCGHASCPTCCGDVVVAAQRRAVLQCVHRKRPCLDPVLDAVKGYEHLLSDLEVTILVLLANGAPLSIELGEATADEDGPVPSATQGAAHATVSSRLTATTTADSKRGSALQHTGALSAATAPASVGSSNSRCAITHSSRNAWRLPVEVPEALDGAGRALVAACSVNSWPLVAGMLACMPSGTPLHQVCLQVRA
jgi:hypothetical protein